MKTQNEYIRTRILIPFGLGFVLLVGFLIFSDYFYLYRPKVRQEVDKRLDSLQKMFEAELDHDAELLTGLIEIIGQNKAIQKRWLDKNRKELLDLTLPLFEETFSEYRVTHCYFIDLDQVCFLRVHNPKRNGDLITRHTMAQAVETGEPAHGIELGHYGTFTLHTVVPWRIDGELVGYIELGEEIEHLTPRLSQILEVEIVFLINKNFLDHERWLEGLEMMGRTGDWNQYKDFVVVDSTLKNRSLEINDFLKFHEEEEHEQKSHKETKRSPPKSKYALFNLIIDERSYKAGFLKLLDAAGQDVGEILLLRDITQNQSELHYLTRTQILVSLLLGACMLLAFIPYLGWVEKKLTKARSELLREIEDRKNTQEALRKSGEFLQTVIDGVSEPITVIGLDYRIVMANRASRLLGGDKDPVADSRCCYQLSHHRDTPCAGTEHQCPLDLVVKSKAPCMLIHTHYDAQGNETIIELSAAPIFDEKGEVIQIIEWSHDITERLRLSAKQEALSRKMQDTQKLESLGVMAAGIAHHFNNILQIVLGYADLLRNRLDEKSSEAEMIREIEKAATRAAGISAHMLTYSGQGRVEFQEVNLTSLVHDVIDLMQASIPELIRLDHHLAHELPSIHADLPQIHQCVLNLMTNALEAMGELPGVITVTTGTMHCDLSYFSDNRLNEDLPEGPYVFIEVSDSGCGMNAETQKKIFEPFFTTKFMGRGLGLAALLAIVRRHKGAIKVSSQPDAGTVFRVLFPALGEEKGNKLA